MCAGVRAQLGSFGSVVVRKGPAASSATDIMAHHNGKGTAANCWPLLPLLVSIITLASTYMLHALEQIRRMRGGAPSHLMRCSDGNYYVVKFQNNPQHRRILVNALLGTRLASRLRLPTTPLEVIYDYLQP